MNIYDKKFCLDEINREEEDRKEYLESVKLYDWLVTNVYSKEGTGV